MRTLLVAFGLLCWTSPVSALQAASPQPSQEDQDKKVKESKPPAKPPARVITIDDLRDTRRSVRDEPAGEASTEGAKAQASTGAKGGKGEKSDEEVKAERSAEIQKKIDQQAKVIAAVRKAMDDAQTELNDVSNYTFGGRRAALLKILEDGQAEVAKAEQTIADLEEEAQANGLSVSRP